MTYAQFDDRFDDDPRFAEAGWDLEHYGLHACAVTYCGRHLTDGHIPVLAVCRFGRARPRRNLKLAAKLCDDGLWRRTSTGFEIVDYLQEHASRAEILKRRAELSAVRAEAGRKGGLRSGEVRRRDASVTGEGMRRGEPRQSAAEAPSKQPASIDEANGKQPRSKVGASAPPIASEPAKPNEPLSPPILSTPSTKPPPVPPTGGTGPAKPPWKLRVELSMLVGIYREGVVSGLREATGRSEVACAEFEPRSWRDIERALRAYGPPDGGEEEQSDWVRTKTAAYVRATYPTAQFQCGYHPRKFVEWLNTGQREPSAPTVVGAPRQQYSDPTAPWLQHEREAS